MENALKIVNNIKTGIIKDVVVVTGAGISCASGIPDFRSPGGMYATLNPALLTATEKQKEEMTRNPTAVVDFSLFKHNQFPYLEVRRPFILGTHEKIWKPTLSHFFLRVLHDKGMLRRLYTQNIDGIDFNIGVPDEKLVHVHGSLQTISCEFCGSSYPYDEFISEVGTNIRNIYDPADPTAPAQSTNILCKQCHQPGVKPSTVLYGRDIPTRVFQLAKQDFPTTGLIVVIGTSLTVSPACNLVARMGGVSPVPRLVVNMERVGEQLGLSFDPAAGVDGCIEGECDAGLLLVLKELGWLDDILLYKDLMCDKSAALLDAITPLSSSSSARSV